MLLFYGFYFIKAILVIVLQKYNIFLTFQNKRHKNIHVFSKFAILVQINKIDRPVSPERSIFLFMPKKGLMTYHLYGLSVTFLQCYSLWQ